MTNTRRPKNRKFIIPLALILVIIASGFGYYYWNQTSKTTLANAATPSYKTSTVKEGSITISATGTGAVVTGQTVNLSFSSTGTVAALNVQVGDKVTKGQELARLNELTTLQTSLTLAQVNLTAAQQALETLKQNASTNLANAQIALNTAQKTLTDAKSAVVTNGIARCDSDTTAAYYASYLALKKQLDGLDTKADPTSAYYQGVVVPVKRQVDKAYTLYMWCGGYTNYEIDSSQAALALAQASLTDAQTKLADLQKNNGVDPVAQAQAENTIATDQIALEKAQQALDGATLTAPFAGVVMSVAGSVGDAVTSSSTAFITISDLDHPQIEFLVDETDMQLVAVNETAQVSFDAIANKTFTGKVIRVYPTLATANGYNVLKGLIQVDLSNEKTTYTFPIGMNAKVEVVNAEAKKVLIVPIEALRDLGGGEYSVFVLSNGVPKMVTVKVGLQDAASAEITEGLKAGDVVTTGTGGAQ
jgi:HlyD family secretion protein